MRNRNSLFRLCLVLLLSLIALFGFGGLATAATALDDPEPATELVEPAVVEETPPVVEETPPVVEEVVVPEEAAPAVVEEAPVASLASVSDEVQHIETTFCHKPGEQNQQELTTDDDGFLQGHLGHGDSLGTCPQLFDGWVTWASTNYVPVNPSLGSLGLPQNFVGYGQLTPETCGLTYQQDHYVGTLAAVNALVNDSMLTGTIQHPEDENLVTEWHFVSSGPCPVITNVCTQGSGDTSTDLSPTWADIDTRSAGHSEYVDGGLHVWTDNNSSQAKVSQAHAGSFLLRNTGTLGIDWTGTTPAPGLNLFVNFGADGNGTLVYEGVYGQDLWLTNGSSSAVKLHAPVNGGGNGSQWHGTINQWLSVYPDATVTGFAFSYGSGVFGDGVLHSVTVNCATYSFDAVDTIEVTPPVIVTQFSDWAGSPVCGEDSFVQTRTKTVTTTLFRIVVLLGAYVNQADEPTSVVTNEDRTVEIEAQPCPTETPTPTPSDTPTVTPTPSATPVVTVIAAPAAPQQAALAHTGSAWDVIAPYALAFLMIGISLVVATVLGRRYDKRHHQSL